MSTMGSLLWNGKVWLAAFVFAAASADLAKAQSVDRADVSSLCRAVEMSTTLEIKYSGDPENAQRRIILPHAVGYTQSKDVLLFALQVDGYSELGKLKSWREFRADRILYLSALDQPFRPANRKYPKNIPYECKANSVTAAASKAASKTVLKTDQVTSLEHTELCAAVKNKFIVEARLKDDPQDQPIRMMVPHALGPNKQGRLMVFVFQTDGYSPTTGDGRSTIPGWRTFRLDNLAGIKVTDRKYAVVKTDLSKSNFITEPSCTAE